jgi:GT2 family glycosyltransferase
MDLSVIVVSYNTKKLLKQCLDSVFKHTQGINFEVIVVDNASQDRSREYLKSQNSKLKTTTQNFKLILNNHNLGFAKANNQGIKLAKGKYILLLNSDTILKENSLKKMVDWMEVNLKVGIASCQLAYQDGSLQRTGGYFPSLLRVFNWMFFLDDLPLIKELVGSFHPHEPQTGWLSSRYFRKEHFQDWVTGAFFLVRKKVIDQIGILDEKFFMYVEEVEFCYRAKKTGWQVVYTPITKIIHLALKSGSQEGARLGEYRGLIYFYKKHKPGWQLPILKILLKAGALLRLLIFGIMRNDPEMRRIYAQAFKVD